MNKDFALANIGIGLFIKNLNLFFLYQLKKKLISDKYFIIYIL